MIFTQDKPGYHGKKQVINTVFLINFIFLLLNCSFQTYFFVTDFEYCIIFVDNSAYATLAGKGSSAKKKKESR